MTTPWLLFEVVVVSSEGRRGEPSKYTSNSSSSEYTFVDEYCRPRSNKKERFLLCDDEDDNDNDDWKFKSDIGK
jgi:hypothetical protein